MKNNKFWIVCGVIIAIPVVVFLLKGSTAFLSLLGKNYLWIMLIVCPLSHFFMMRGMHGKGNGHCGSSNDEVRSTKGKLGNLESTDGEVRSTNLSLESSANNKEGTKPNCH